jgi:endonuclease/exonuclease/phosphatase family metal-dependent hydrolase
VADLKPLRTLEATAILLLLLQAVRVLFSVLFGFAYDAVFAATMGFGSLAVVVLSVIIAFLAPLVAPRRNVRVVLLIAALIAVLARIPLTINQPTVRLWSGLLLIAAAGIYVATLLCSHPRIFATALILAFAADQFLRAAGNTYDISLRTWWLPVQAVFSMITCVMARLAFSRDRLEEQPSTKSGIDIPSGLALGALLFLETSLLGFPNGLARWTGADYAIVAPLLMAATLLPFLRTGQWGGFAIFVVTLLVGWMTGHKLCQLALLAPMLLAQLSFLSASQTLAHPSRSGHPRLSLTMGLFHFLLLHVVLALAFAYPYTIPFLRDRGDYVYLFAILFLLVPAIVPRPREPLLMTRRLKTLCWAGVALVVIATIAFARPPAFPPREPRTDQFRVGTYNIHYGYNTHWRFSLEQQARTIERSGADVVMLQEVDAGRITSYGVDDALWLARRLDMHVVFGPALEELSGVALLSRFPMTETNVQPLTSQLEQTVIVRARVLLAGRAPDTGHQVDAYATWLGLEPEERARQLDDALSYIGDANPAVLGGDFNATPGSPTYDAIQTAGFNDPFIAGGFDPQPTSPAEHPSQRIDFVWVRNLDVRAAQVLDSLASDHRMVVVELAFP